MDGSEELSPHLPSFLRPFYLALLLISAVLLALIKKGPPRTTPFQSVIHLIIHDTYLTWLFYSSTTTLLMALRYSPYDNISVSLIGPIFLFLSVLVYHKKTDPTRRYLYTLWILAESMCIVDDILVDLPALHYTGKLISDNDHQLFSLHPIQTNSKIQFSNIRSRPSNPFIFAMRLHQWRQQTREFYKTTLVTSVHAIELILKHSERRLLDDGSNDTRRISQKSRFLTSWTRTCQFIPHRRFGALWHRVTNRTCVDRNTTGAWFIGAEVIQSLKHSLAIQYLSCDIFFHDSMQSLWDWAAHLNVSFRKRSQISAVAEEIARENGGHVNNVIRYANILAGVNRHCEFVPIGMERRMGVEANVVAVFGLAVHLNYCKLDVNQLWEQLVVGVFQHDVKWAEHVIVRSVQSWPHRDIAKTIICWISASCDVPFTYCEDM